MSKILEYAIMAFLAGILVIMARWSENGRYQVNVGSSAHLLIDTRTGDAWFPNSEKMLIPPEK